MTETIVLASGNAGKLTEFQSLLADVNLEVLPQSQFAIPDAEETGLSFVENAIIKARHACQHSGLPAIADDSGLAVDYLGGKPGIYSARFAGEHGNDAKNNQKLLKELEGVTEAKRTAQFLCVLVFMRHAEDPTPIICQGIWPGVILEKPQGENGFGYDPLFWVPEQRCSSAELTPAVKNRISHRGRALKLLLEALSGSGK